MFYLSSVDLHLNHTLVADLDMLPLVTTCYFQVLTYIWLAKWTEDKAVNGTIDRDQTLFRLSVYGYLGIGQGENKLN